MKRERTFFCARLNGLVSGAFPFAIKFLPRPMNFRNNRIVNTIRLKLRHRRLGCFAMTHSRRKFFRRIHHRPRMRVPICALFHLSKKLRQAAGSFSQAIFHVLNFLKDWFNLHT